MKNFIAVFLLVWCGSAWAEAVYVIDNVNAKLRSGKGENYRTLRVLPAKTEVEVIEADDDEFTKVKTSEGQVGWIKSSLLKSQRGDVKDGAEGAQSVAPVTETNKDSPATLDAVAPKLESESNSGSRNHGQTESSLATMLMIAFGAFLAGVATGVVVLRAYYLRRLHGLRI